MSRFNRYGAHARLDLVVGPGLEHYVEAFQANHIDGEVLPRLTADDLTALCITSVGHRRKLLDAIAALERRRVPAGAEALPGRCARCGPNAASLRCCSAIWSARPSWPRASIPRTCGR